MHLDTVLIRQWMALGVHRGEEVAPGPAPAFAGRGHSYTRSMLAPAGRICKLHPLTQRRGRFRQTRRRQISDGRLGLTRRVSGWPRRMCMQND